jgi:hypothetical protein
MLIILWPIALTRVIKLLPGNRHTQNDISSIAHAWFRIPLNDGEADKLTIDCARWLDGSTVSSAVSGSAFLVATLASPNVTLAVSGSSSQQSGDITVTASDGRIRKVTIETMPAQQPFPVLDYA